MVVSSGKVGRSSWSTRGGVPPFAPHREENPNAAEEAVVVLARSTQEAIVVNLASLFDDTAQ